MYTLEDIRDAVQNAEHAKQGKAMFDSGAVRQAKCVPHGAYDRYFGAVRDGVKICMASFTYTPAIDWISNPSCDCGEFAKTQKSCPHVAALLYYVLHNQLESSAAAGESSRLHAHREAMALRREQIRLEEMRREQEAREEERARIDAFIGASRMSRFVMEQEEKASLFPVLFLSEGKLFLELRIGIKKPYIVRSLQEFADRMERRESFVYGKELIFSHRQEDVREEDHVLLWQIVALAQQSGDGARAAMTGAQLDQTMRLLMDREIDFRKEDGKLVRAKVCAGEEALRIYMQEKAEDYLLRVETENVVHGTAGAYFIMPDEGKILCMFGNAFDRIAPLLRLRSAYPQGMRLQRDQLAAACANLIAPAAAGVAITGGQAIIREHTPMALNTRFYIDMQSRNCLVCRVEYDYGAVKLAPGEENPHIRRDETAEEAAMLAAKRLFPIEKENGELAFEGNDDACFELVEKRLRLLTAHGEVLLVDRLTRMDVKKRSAMSIGVSVSEPGMLLVKADLGGLSQEDLQAAYLAHRLKKKYVRLESGAFLSGDALEQAAEAAQTLESMDVTAAQAQQGTQIPASRALYLDAALKERESIKLSAPKAVTDWIERLAAAQKTRAENPKTLKATLRDYQLEGLSWMTALCESGFSGILADDMGLGKTMQALALLLSCKERGENVRALVVCPASLQLNWENEAEKFAPTLSVLALMGDAKEREEKIAVPTELLIVSYDQLRRDVQRYKDIQFTHIFLDEAQNIKNAASQAAKAVKTLKSDHRFAMTGTPIENRLSELWSIFDFLMPGYLLTYKKFKDRFETKIVKDGNEKALRNLRMMTAPFILRRMKADVLDDLPEKTEKIMTSEMTPEQKQLYHAHAAQLIARADGGMADQKERIAILAGLTRLRQICCDPRLCVEEYAGGSGKLDQCIELVAQMLEGGHRVLLFSQFTGMLDILKSQMETMGIATFSLTGDTDKEERMDMVKRFNAGEAQVFLISLKAGGTGLNLTGADVVIHYDPWWNTSAQNQATDRAYRIGQKRGVQVIKLIAGDTIEARILKLQESKKELSDGVLAGGENLYTIDAQALKKLLR